MPDTSDGGAAVVIGASERTPWSYWAITNLARGAYADRVWAVNPSRADQELYGAPVVGTLDEVPGSVDLAVVLTSAIHVFAIIEALAERGCAVVVVVSAGFADRGVEGRQAQDELVELARRNGMTLYGPNGVGLASVHDGVSPLAVPMPADPTPGVVSVVSQSGALLAGFLEAAGATDLGIDRAWSIGNGAMVDVEHVLESLVERDETRVVALLLEGLRNPDVLLRCLSRLRAAGKPVVALLAGRSARARQVAESHTGALVGEGRLVDARLRANGVVTVDSVDELLAAATLLTASPDLAHGHPEGVFLVSGSGFGAALAADSAAKHRVPLATLSEETSARLRELLPDGTAITNPLDLVGGAPETRDQIYAAIAADPGVGALVEAYTIRWPDDTEGRSWHREALKGLARTAEEGQAVVALTSLAAQPPTPWLTELVGTSALLVLGSVDAACAALGGVFPPAPSVVSSAGESGFSGTVMAEADGRRALQTLSSYLVPGTEVESAHEAAAEAAALPPPYVVKLSVPGVSHKGEHGRVVVGLHSSDEVLKCADEMLRAAVDQGVTGGTLLIQQQVSGPEVLVGLTRDQTAGPCLTVSIGGWAAELAVDPLIVPLPCESAKLRRRLSDAGFGRALGHRGEQLWPLLEDMANHFTTGGLSDMQVVECNPVIVSSDGPYIADVLLVRSPS